MSNASDRSCFGRAAQRTVLKDLGEHPSEGGKIEVLDGKYGAYVSHNKVNATVPKGKDPASLTVGEAVALLEERIAKGGGKPARKGGFKKSAKAKAADGDGLVKTAPKKPAAKKAATTAKKPAAAKPAVAPAKTKAVKAKAKG